MSRAPALLFAALLILTSAAAAVLTLAAFPDGGKAERAEQFHRLVGGLGFGPALDLSECEFSFDPRLCPACSNDCGPIPGGIFFCPHHASSIFYCPPLHSRRVPGDVDGLLP